MGKHQRTKGHNFERRVARCMRAVWPDAKRGYQVRGGTSEAPDVDGTPFYIECKVGQRPVIRRALKQASSNTDGRPPMAVTKVDCEEPVVTMYLGDFLRWIC